MSKAPVAGKGSFQRGDRERGTHIWRGLASSELRSAARFWCCR